MQPQWQDEREVGSTSGAGRVRPTEAPAHSRRRETEPGAWVIVLAVAGLMVTSVMLYLVALGGHAVPGGSTPPRMPVEPREAAGPQPTDPTLVVYRQPAAAAASGMQMADRQSNPPRSLDELTINELVGRVGALEAQLAGLRAENAQLQLQLAESEDALTGLRAFIQDHDTYGPAYEEYTFFRERREREERARAAAEAKARREAERDALRQRAEEARERHRREQAMRRGEPIDPNDPEAKLARRHEILRKAGYTRVGEAVYVSEMGTSYRTERDREVRYSYLLRTWYVDDDEIVDFSELTISGTVIHAAADPHDVAIAVAFFNEDGGQVGETVVRVDGARGGVPYPFTSKIDMAADRPFDNYTAWVLYFDPVASPAQSQPQQGSTPSTSTSAP